MSNVIHGGEARSGRRIIYTASAGVAIAALLTQTTFGEWAKDRLSGVSMHDECDNFHPFYNPPAGAVVSCAPLVDRTNQQVERRVYQVVPKPNSLKALDNGDYAVAAALYHEDGVAMRFFGRSTLNLIQLDEEL